MRASRNFLTAGGLFVLALLASAGTAPAQVASASDRSPWVPPYAAAAVAPPTASAGQGAPVAPTASALPSAPLSAAVQPLPPVSTGPMFAAQRVPPASDALPPDTTFAPNAPLYPAIAAEPVANSPSFAGARPLGGSQFDLAALPPVAVAPLAANAGAVVRAEGVAPAGEAVRLPDVGVVQTSAEASFAAPAASPMPSAGDTQFFTLTELKDEMKKLAWKKGDFTITPYAWLWASMSYETERTYVGDYTFFVLSSQDQGEPAFHINAKSTRLGIDVTGPKLGCLGDAATGGKVEFDFEGQFTTENKASVLLRHAYWEAKTDEFRILAGQTWDVISPLYPNSIMYSIYWGAGNIGYRRAQFRGERYFAFSDAVLWTLQGSINADIVSDTATGYTGDKASWPVVEGRTAITLGPRGKDCYPIVLGVSGHIGEQVFDFTAAPAHDDAYIRTWSCNLDAKIPFGARFGVQGELFMGSDLSAYLGGILQGIDLARREGIYSRGGWIETYYYWTKQLHSHVGYTLDDPLDSDLSAASARTYNQAVWGNLVYDVTKQFIVGIEFAQWKTLYLGKEPGEASRIEFMTKYCF